MINNIPEYTNLNPRYYKFLKAINLARKVGSDRCEKYEIEIVLSRISNSTTKNLHLRCLGAFNVQFGSIEGMFGLLVTIEDVSGQQLEGAMYRVSEQEEGTFSFFCKSFTAELSDE